ncbi:hypothetical protein DKX38_028996 [Salix brachista]|uniref:Uncharacterized protein n=1 Tax=Salix brachista TaxID=2182728 RepID=A0A5N5IXZ8_9ROSI|nr:hypothetical protein DKX38_028996 [Salix brachista]
MPWLLKLAGWRVNLRNLGFKARILVESEKDTLTWRILTKFERIIRFSFTAPYEGDRRLRPESSNLLLCSISNEKGKEPNESDDAPAEQVKPEASETEKPTEPEVHKEEPSAVKEEPPAAAPAPPAAAAAPPAPPPAEPKTTETLEEKKPVQTETKTTETEGEKEPEETR